MTAQETVSAMQRYIDTVNEQIAGLEEIHPELAGLLSELLLKYRNDQSVTVGMYLEGRTFRLPENREAWMKFIRAFGSIAKYHQFLYGITPKGLVLERYFADDDPDFKLWFF